MNVTVSRMREQMTLKTEESAMAKFRTTMKSAERFKRYLRMDSEGLSMLLAKVTLTTCYGIPRKGEVGYISEDEDEDPPERTTKARMGKWNEIDPIGMVEPKHHTDRGYQVPDETKSLPLEGPSAPAGISREYDKTLEAIGRKTPLTMIWVSSRTSFSRPRARFPGERWTIQRTGKRLTIFSKVFLMNLR